MAERMVNIPMPLEDARLLAIDLQATARAYDAAADTRYRQGNRPDAEAFEARAIRVRRNLEQIEDAIAAGNARPMTAPERVGVLF